MDDDDAFEVDWLSKIEWLRRLLNDQYLTGLPIIKELLQNADDARATRLEIALVPGSTQEGDPTRHNPLFDGPALMVVNDGRFTDDNAVSIRQLGLSNKPGEQGAIGRFGLGLKSVFHLGEAFFYLSNNRSPRMLNPWSGSGEHENWTRIDDEHHEHMRNQIARVISGDPWFCLWIPLRKQSHASGYRHRPSGCSLLAAQRADDDIQRRASLERLRRRVRDDGDKVDMIGYHDLTELPVQYALPRQS